MTWLPVLTSDVPRVRLSPSLSSTIWRTGCGLSANGSRQELDGSGHRLLAPVLGFVLTFPQARADIPVEQRGRAGAPWNFYCVQELDACRF
jgi:hypothetical protein